MTNWLDTQPKDVLEWWVKESEVPKLATLPDGEILYVNRAFEKLTDYTEPELVGKKTWMELTVDQSDTEADAELARQTFEGKRTRYSFQKKYRTKSGNPVPVLIHILRYPEEGNFQEFLVSVSPLSAGHQIALDQVSELSQYTLGMKNSLKENTEILRELVNDQKEYITRPPWYKPVLEWAKEKPLYAAAVTLLFLSVLFGKRVIENAKEIIDLVR